MGFSVLYVHHRLSLQVRPLLLADLFRILCLLSDLTSGYAVVLDHAMPLV